MIGYPQMLAIWSLGEAIDRRGHRDGQCIDLENWQFCSGPSFWIKSLEDSGVSREEIKRFVKNVAETSE